MGIAVLAWAPLGGGRLVHVDTIGDARTRVRRHACRDIAGAARRTPAQVALELGHLQGRGPDSRRADEGAGRRELRRAAGGCCGKATQALDAVAVLDGGYYNDPEAVSAFCACKCLRSSGVLQASSTRSCGFVWRTNGRTFCRCSGMIAKVKKGPFTAKERCHGMSRGVGCLSVGMDFSRGNFARSPRRPPRPSREQVGRRRSSAWCCGVRRPPCHSTRMSSIAREQHDPHKEHRSRQARDARCEQVDDLQHAAIQVATRDAVFFHGGDRRKSFRAKSCANDHLRPLRDEAKIYG